MDYAVLQTMYGVIISYCTGMESCLDFEEEKTLCKSERRARKNTTPH